MDKPHHFIDRLTRIQSMRAWLGRQCWRLL